MKGFPCLFALVIALIAALPPSSAPAADVRADFLKIIDRPRVPPDVEITALPTLEGLAKFHFTFSADSQQRVPGLLLFSTQAPLGRKPVVIALHGTGGSKSDELPLLRQLARRGFIAVAIDGRYHGERAKSGRGEAEYEAAIVRAWKDGGEHPFYYDTVWDVMRLIDYLQTRDDVDPRRIGLYGVSKGGIETYLTAAVDPRVTVAVPCIGMESFAWALDHNDWQTRIGTIQNAFDTIAHDSGVNSPDTDFVRRFYARLVPGIDGEFDGPAMIRLIAPRPLMTINGDSDAHTPLPGLRLCIDAAEPAYHAAGADDRFIYRIEENTPHRVNPDAQIAAVDWFVKWLNP